MNLQIQLKFVASFLLIGLLAPASAIARNDEVVFWKGLQVSFVLRTTNRRDSLFIKHGRDAQIAEGTAILVPRIPEGYSPRFSPKTMTTKRVPTDAPWQLVMLNRNPYVLLNEGRIIQLPPIPDQIVPEVAHLGRGLAVGYHKNGVYHLQLITTRHRYVYEDYRANSLQEVARRIDHELTSIDRGFGDKTPLKDLIDDNVKVHAVAQNRHYKFDTTLENWPNKMAAAFHNSEPDIQAFLDSKTVKTPVAGTSSAGGKGAKVGATMSPPAQQLALPSPSGLKGVEKLRRERALKNDLLNGVKSVVYGQDFAIERIAAQISELRKSDGTIPKVLIGTGPSGSGKTFTATQIGNRMGLNVLEVSGNEYSSHAGSLDYSTLLGSQGSDKKAGILPEFAKANQNGFLFIINEGDKMHPDIWKKLMEFLGQGTIQDRDGKKVTVRNLLVLITTNRGALRMYPAKIHNWPQADLDRRTRNFTQAELTSYFTEKDGPNDSFQLPPEIVKRVAEIIAFGPTSKEAALMIAAEAVRGKNEFFKNEYKLITSFDPSVIEAISVGAWSESPDARSIIRRVTGAMSQILDDGLDALALKDNDVIGVTLQTDNRGRKTLRATANNREITVPLGMELDVNPIRDVEQRRRFREMRDKMNEQVVGQTNAVNSVSFGVISRLGKKDGKPYVALLLGPSGIGKTEISRALALHRFGDIARMETIPMGEIQDEHKFDAMFGVGGHMQSGDQERVFERILRNHPEGCVINFGEISNMGGRDPVKKAALFMRLYNFFEEGIYISPRDGKIFHLYKYLMLLDGNDGEKDFLGITHDDLLMERYNSARDPGRLREMLLSTGIPNAFLNRVDTIELLKPLLRAEIQSVTKKLWKSGLADFVRDFPEVEVEASDAFLKQLSESFFTADKGGRAVREVLENHVRGLLNYGLINLDTDPTDFSGFKLRVSLEDTATKKPYQISTAPRKVGFKLELEKDGTIVHTESLDVSNGVPKIVAMSQVNAKLTAIHEAGHAVGNDPKRTKIALRYVTIRGGAMGSLKFYGYAGYEPIKGTEGGNVTRDQLMGELVANYSGRVAQELAGFPPDYGWGRDLETMRKMVSEYLTRYGLEDGFIGLAVDKEGNPIIKGGYLAEQYQKTIVAILEEARKEAVEILTKNWPLVRSLAAELLRKGQFDKTRFEEIRTAVERGETATVRNRKAPKPWVDPSKKTCEAFPR